MTKIDEYQSQNIFEPKYLFHGSPFEIEQLEPKQSYDDKNIENEDNAIFLTSYFFTAVAYSFRNKIKEFNKHYSFSINNNGELPVMSFEADNLPDELYGYVYVFKKDDSIIRDNRQNTTQYKCYHNLKPLDVIKVYYSDYIQYFERKNEQSKLK